MPAPRFATLMLYLAVTVCGALAPVTCFGTRADLSLSRHLVAALAADSGRAVPGTPRLSNMPAEQFLRWHDEVDRKLRTTRYEHISVADLAEVDREQARIRRLVGSHASMDELSGDDQLAVFNAHERVVAILEDAEDDRVICRLRFIVGSHLPVSVCSTVGELRAASRALGRDELFRQFPCARPMHGQGEAKCRGS